MDLQMNSQEQQQSSNVNEEQETKIRRKRKREEIVGERELGIGLDIGTAFCVSAKSVNKEAHFRVQRDAFFDLENNTMSRSMLKKLNANFIESEDNRNLFVIGEEALQMANFFNKEARRPLSHGCISTREKEALAMIKLIIHGLLGDPKKQNEVCHFSVPAKPLDEENYNVVYHENILKSFITSFGYKAIPMNEAFAIAWADLEDDEYSGMALSFGAGMTNTCLSGDTKIPLINGEIKTIKELADNFADKQFWVYSCKEDGEIVPGKAFNPRKTKENASVIRIWLDNNEYFDCTEDHLIMMRGGTYKKAAELEVNDSLMPLYLNFYKTLNANNKNLYKQIKNNKTQKWHREHRYTYQHFFECKLSKEDVIHHKDFNGLNNCGENLQLVTGSEHKILHEKLSTSLSNFRRGKTFEQLYGIERGIMLRRESGNANRGKKQSKEIIEKRKNTIKRRKQTDKNFAYRMASGFVRYVLTHVKGKKINEIYGSEKAEQMRQKMSQKKKNIPYSLKFKSEEKANEVRRKLSEIGKGKFGKYVRTKEINAKISNSLKGKRVWNKGLKGDEYMKYYKNGIKNQYSLTQNNHKVIKIEKLENNIDVYDLSVEKYHNFAINSGIFVHNCLSFLGISEKEHQFSVARGGDWIDTNAANAVGLKASRITTIKESGMDLKEPKDREQNAIKIYYENLIKYVCSALEKRLTSDNVPNFPEPITVIVSGGTSKIKNFETVFEEELRAKTFPFKIKQVKRAKDQLNAVAKGCLLNSLNYEE